MPIIIKMKNDFGEQIYINAANIMSMVIHPLNGTKYTRVETRTFSHYVEETPEEILALIRIAAEKEG